MFGKTVFIFSGKAEFSTSLLLQSSVSHDPSEIILIWWSPAQETFLIIINVENRCAASYFCGNHDTFLQDSVKVKELQESSKEHNLFKIAFFVTK